jgi:two-component system response regulator FixJ
LDLSEAGVLTLDVRRPEMSGIEVQEKVVHSGTKMPAVFMTDHENEEIQIVAMESGAVFNIKKLKKKYKYLYSN